MKKFRVEIVETYRRFVEVEAQDEDAAYQDTDDRIAEGTIDLPCDGEDYKYDRELFVSEVKEDNEGLEEMTTNTHMLYGIEMVENDTTLKDFATCIYNSVPLEAVIEDSEERKDFILEMAETALEDDISCTDIDYEGLLYKYRCELGDLFYRMQDRGYTIPNMEFTGEGAKQFFNDIVYYYIAVHYDEFAQGKM